MIYSKITEKFSLISGGSKTDISDSVKVKKNFENNQKIDRSMTVNSLTKIFNNVASDVIQKNSASASSAVGASNTIFIQGIKCPVVKISGIKQLSSAELQMQVQTKQTNTSKIVTEITTSIDKTIEKVGSTDLDKLQANNSKQLNDYMKAMPGYDPNKAQKLASKCPSGGGLLSAGNKCNVDTSYELDSSVKMALELDESFKINDTDEVSNEIKNKVEQVNFASCQSAATSDNAIIIQDIMCTVNNAATDAEKKGGSFEFSDVDQQALSKLYMTCVFDQQNVSDIANKMMNSISKRYNQIYDAVEEKAKIKGPEYYQRAADLVDLLAASGMEQIQAAAGDIPPRTDVITQDKMGSTENTIISDKPTNINQPIEQPKEPINEKINETINETKKEDIVPVSTETTTDNTFNWLIIGGILFLIIIVIIIIVRIKLNNNNQYDDDE